MPDAEPIRSHILGEDGRARCPWPGADAFYVAYHDTEWGVPERDSRGLFEKLILDGFQAGLSWITILRKRENFRKAFAAFDPAKIARFDDKKIAALMDDAGIIRNRQKVEGTVASAKAWLAIEEREGFANFLWKYLDGVPLQNAWTHVGQVPASTPLSEKMSKALKDENFKFCGPTIVYAFMQATGMVNDHLVGCHRHADCAGMAALPAQKPHPDERSLASGLRPAQGQASTASQKTRS